jgi:hypothetical protein
VHTSHRMNNENKPARKCFRYQLMSRYLQFCL